MQSSVQLEGNCIGSRWCVWLYRAAVGMWTHSGYQLSQIARVKPTHSLTSASAAPYLLLPSLSLSLSRLFFSPRSSFLFPQLLPRPLDPCTQVPSSNSTNPPSSTPIHPPLDVPSSSCRHREPASFPRQRGLPPDFWLLLSPASCSVTKSIRCFVEFSRPPLLDYY